MANVSKHRSLSQAYSIVEILVVIAVIGIISAIAVPNFATFKGQSEQARAKRNAQSLSKTYAAALAAGHDFAKDETEISNVVQNIVTGTVVILASGDDVYLSVPALATEQQVEAAAHLQLTGGRLTYKH